MIARMIITTLMSLCFCLSAKAADIPRIDNGQPPTQGKQELQLKELWRAGHEDDDIFFGSVNRVSGDRDGNIYMLDIQLFQVFVYNADGELLRTIGRQGDGPGEVRNLNDMTLLPDGAVGLGQAFPGRIVKLRPDGTPAGTLLLGEDATDTGNVVVLLGTRSRGGGILVAGMFWGFDEPGVMSQRMFLSGLQTAGGLGTEFLTKSYPISLEKFIFSEKDFDFVWTRCDLTAEGDVVFAPERNAYEIHVSAPDGTPKRVFTREYETLRRDDQGMKQARMTMEATSRHFGRPVAGVEIENTEPAITHLCTRENGEIWVRTGRGDFRRQDGVLTTYDVFDDEGHLLRRTDLVGPGDPATDAIHLLPGKRVVVVRGAVDAYRRDAGATTSDGADESAAGLEVVCYGY